jgi:hypothetical protein
MNPNDPATFWLLVIISTALLIAFLVREAYLSLRYTKQQRLDIEAQRLMLRFCKNPTRANWADAWDYISENEVMLAELDWPLVQRFTRTAVSVNFSPGVER